jgi:hypothetical protein
MTLNPRAWKTWAAAAMLLLALALEWILTAGYTGAI